MKMETLHQTQKTFFEEIFILTLKEDSYINILIKLSEELFSSGIVTKKYQNALLERERSFPTGMPTAIPAALPHTDSEHCLKNALAIGILEEPVTFGLMGGEEGDTVDVKIVFMLSLPNPKSQIVIIQGMLEILRNDHMMQLLIKNGKENTNKAKKMLVDYFSKNDLHYSEEK